MEHILTKEKLSYCLDLGKRAQRLSSSSYPCLSRRAYIEGIYSSGDFFKSVSHLAEEIAFITKLSEMVIPNYLTVEEMAAPGFYERVASRVKKEHVSTIDLIASVSRAFVVKAIYSGKYSNSRLEYLQRLVRRFQTPERLLAFVMTLEEIRCNGFAYTVIADYLDRIDDSVLLLD